MRLIAIGISPAFGGGGDPLAPAMRLSGLGVYPENIAAGTALGTLSVINVSGSPTFGLSVNDGNRVALTGANLTRGATAWDHETHPVVTILVTVSGVTPGIAPRVFVLLATNVLEVTLAALGLSPSTIPEGSAAGTVVGAITGVTGGSTLSLTDDAGGRFAISGTNLVAGSVATDYETSTLHAITIRETHPDAAARDTALAVTVTNVEEGGGIGPFTLTWTSAATELTDVVFSITPALLEGDSAVIAFDNNSDMSSPFTTSAANAIDSSEAGAGSITFTGLTLPLPLGLNYAQVTVSRPTFADVTTNIVPKTLVASGDTTAPVLTLPTGTKTGTTTATLTVSTDEANGTLYGSASASAPSKAQIKAGQTSTGAASSYAFNQAVSSTGVQTKNATGLTAATTYTMHYMQEDTATNQSNIASASSFTTDAAAAPLAFDAASEKSDAGGVTTQSWTHTPVGTPTGVVVAMAYWQPALTAPTSVKYGGAAMALEANVDTNSYFRFYSLANPPAGPQTVEIIWASLAYPASGCISVTGGSTTDVLRTLPTPTSGTIYVPGLTDEILVPSAVGELVVDVIFGYATGITIGAGQTQRCAPPNVASQHFRMSTEPGAASVSMSWVWTDGDANGARAHIGASFNPG